MDLAKEASEDYDEDEDYEEFEDMSRVENVRDAAYIQAMIEFKEIELLGRSNPGFRPTELQKKAIERFLRLSEIHERQ